MSVLRAIESKLESLFEGVFGRAFRTNVQPVELARKLVKEMDDHKNVSVSRVYVPNEYTVYLSPGDREQFASYEQQLAGELSDYLAEHARREGYALLTPPKVQLETDADLDVGVFGIATRMMQSADPPAAAPPTEAEPSHTMIYKPSAPQPTEAASPVELGLEREVAILSWDGERHELAKRRVVLGRSKDADLQVADPNVSRRHAELRQEGATYWLIDLDSTNGVEVRGQAGQAPEAGGRHALHDRLDRDRLLAGERVTLLGSAQVESTLLLLKIGFLILLYLFIWRIVRSAARDLRLPQESMILGPQQAAAAGLVPQAAGPDLGKLVVITSPALPRGRRRRARRPPADRGPRGQQRRPARLRRICLEPPRPLRGSP